MLKMGLSKIKYEQNVSLNIATVVLFMCVKICLHLEN